MLWVIIRGTSLRCFSRVSTMYIFTTNKKNNNIIWLKKCFINRYVHFSPSFWSKKTYQSFYSMYRNGYIHKCLRFQAYCCSTCYPGNFSQSDNLVSSHTCPHWNLWHIHMCTCLHYNDKHHHKTGSKFHIIPLHTRLHVGPTKRQGSACTLAQSVQS